MIQVKVSVPFCRGVELLKYKKEAAARSRLSIPVLSLVKESMKLLHMH